MPEALDQTRFPPPDFAPGDEQRQLDHERQLCQQDAKVRHVIYRHCDGWSESDFLLLACRALEEIVDTTMADQDVFRAYCALDDAMRRAKDAMNGG